MRKKRKETEMLMESPQMPNSIISARQVPVFNLQNIESSSPTSNLNSKNRQSISDLLEEIKSLQDTPNKNVHFDARDGTNQSSSTILTDKKDYVSR